jgi:hypothetical protein
VYDDKFLHPVAMSCDSVACALVCALRSVPRSDLGLVSYSAIQSALVTFVLVCPGLRSLAFRVCVLRFALFRSVW